MARIRRKQGTKEKLLTLTPPLVLEPEKQKGQWQQYFNNTNPIHLELGIGKGKFINSLAKKNPQINYVGVEIVEEVLLKGIEKSFQGGLAPNLAYIWANAENLQEIFNDNEVEKIYLNFSDPWPRKRHAKRRLTHKRFLQVYKDILTEDGVVQFKTDNIELFEFSLNEFANEQWRLQNISLDLYKNLPEDNVATEYETKFVSRGMKIYKLEARPYFSKDFSIKKGEN